MSISLKDSYVKRAVEVARVDLALQATAELRRELQRGAQRPVMDGGPDDLSNVVLREDRDAGELLAPEGLCFPLEVRARPAVASWVKASAS
jgi:hypothetical protein